MNSIFKKKTFSLLIFIGINLYSNCDFAQEKKEQTIILSIQEALQLAKQNNNWISMAKSHKEVSE